MNRENSKSRYSISVASILAAAGLVAGNQLPPPPPAFRDLIQPNVTQSKPCWPPRVAPPKGPPNVLLI